MDRELRTFERRTAKGWFPCRLIELWPGDVFRGFEPDGTSVYWDECTEFIAAGSAYILNGVATVACDKLP